MFIASRSITEVLFDICISSSFLSLLRNRAIDFRQAFSIFPTLCIHMITILWLGNGKSLNYVNVYLAFLYYVTSSLQHANTHICHIVSPLSFARPAGPDDGISYFKALPRTSTGSQRFRHFRLHFLFYPAHQETSRSSMAQMLNQALTGHFLIYFSSMSLADEY
jgi:hypothetical protein